MLLICSLHGYDKGILEDVLLFRICVERKQQFHVSHEPVVDWDVESTYVW